MYITEEQLKTRLNKSELIIKERTRKQRSKGENRLTHDERVLIGVLSEDSPQKDIADLMGVSTNTVSLISRNITSPSIGVDSKLKEDVSATREERGNNELERKAIIQDQLLTNLASALGHVSNNLHQTDAIEASKIAVDMSRILDRVNGNDGGRGSKTAIIINVPSMKEEKHYQSLTV